MHARCNWFAFVWLVAVVGCLSVEVKHGSLEPLSWFSYWWVQIYWPKSIFSLWQEYTAKLIGHENKKIRQLGVSFPLKSCTAMETSLKSRVLRGCYLLRTSLSACSSVLQKNTCGYFGIYIVFLRAPQDCTLGPFWPFCRKLVILLRPMWLSSSARTSLCIHSVLNRTNRNTTT